MAARYGAASFLGLARFAGSDVTTLKCESVRLCLQKHPTNGHRPRHPASDRRRQKRLMRLLFRSDDRGLRLHDRERRDDAPAEALEAIWLCSAQ
jgi:hypothetical protein